MVKSTIAAGSIITRTTDGRDFKVFNNMGNGMITIVGTTERDSNYQQIVKVADLSGFDVKEAPIVTVSDLIAKLQKMPQDFLIKMSLDGTNDATECVAIDAVIDFDDDKWIVLFPTW